MLKLACFGFIAAVISYCITWEKNKTVDVCYDGGAKDPIPSMPLKREVQAGGPGG